MTSVSLGDEIYCSFFLSILRISLFVANQFDNSFSRSSFTILFHTTLTIDFLHHVLVDF